MSKRTSLASKDHLLPVAYLDKLVECSAGLGFDLYSCLDESLQKVVDRYDYHSRVPQSLIADASLVVREGSGRDDLGLYFGFSAKPSIHGYLGHALISAPDLKSAISLLARFQKIYIPTVRQSLELTGESVVVTIREVDYPEAARVMFTEAFLVSFCEFVYLLTGRPLPGLKVKVNWERPDYFKDYEEKLPFWSFGSEKCHVIFDIEALDFRFLWHDPVSQKAAIHHMQEAEADFECRNGDELVQSVRELLVPGLVGFPGLGKVASQLNMSERTLKRRLSDKGVTFQRLLDVEKERFAIKMLKNREISIQEVGFQLGYSDAAGFARAFRRWTGVTPSALKRSLDFKKS